MVRVSGNIEKFNKLNEIQYKDNTDINNFKLDSSKKSWIRIKTKNNEYIIRYITNINSGTKIITLDSDLPSNIEFIDVFEIDNEINMTHTKNKKLKVTDGSTTTTIKLNDSDKNADKLYNNYFILYSDQVRKVKEYKDNILTLDFSLPKAPLKDDEIMLMPHFFNDYIILGIDFTDFLGMDFSDFINNIGGSTNFQLSSLTSIVCCIICCSICILLIFIMMSPTKKRPSQPPIIIPPQAPQTPVIIQQPSPPPQPPSQELKSEVISTLLPYINPLYNKWQPKL